MQEIAILIIIAIVAGMFIKNKKKPELYKKVKDNIKNWHKE